MPTFIVSGSRRITDYALVATTIEAAANQFGVWPTLIIEGGQRTLDENRKPIGGVDYLARLWAECHDIDCETMAAQWLKHGRKAGPIRNREMALRGDYLVAIPDKKSKGTVNMIWAMQHY